jgi:GNAT superfamily N-acetyltransferase
MYAERGGHQPTVGSGAPRRPRWRPDTVYGRIFTVREVEDLLLQLSWLQREHADTVKSRPPTLLRRPKFLRALIGPSRADREDAEFVVRMTDGAETYRQQYLRAAVRGAAYQLSCHLATTEREGSRFWLDQVINRPTEILNGLHLAEIARTLAGVTKVHIAEALRDIDSDYRRCAEAPLHHRPAQDGGTGCEAHNWVWLDADPMRDTYVRWTRSGAQGEVGKIVVSELLHGLGIARRMLEYMIEQHPEVNRWTTTAKTSDGARLFSDMRVRYPHYGWD